VIDLIEVPSLFAVHVKQVEKSRQVHR